MKKEEKKGKKGKREKGKEGVVNSKASISAQAKMSMAEQQTLSSHGSYPPYSNGIIYTDIFIS